MYQDEVLNVEYLGLQCVGFDHQVYKSLRSFFEVSEHMQAAKRARVGRPESLQGSKRQRIHWGPKLEPWDFFDKSVHISVRAHSPLPYNKLYHVVLAV